jgi:hypothetical protein
MTLPRGWGRHLLTFVVVAFVTALPWFVAAHLIWSR